MNLAQAGDQTSAGHVPYVARIVHAKTGDYAQFEEFCTGIDEGLNEFSNRPFPLPGQSGDGLLSAWINGLLNTLRQMVLFLQPMIFVSLSFSALIFGHIGNVRYFVSVARCVFGSLWSPQSAESMAQSMETIRSEKLCAHRFALGEVSAPYTLDPVSLEKPSVLLTDPRWGCIPHKRWPRLPTLTAAPHLALC